MDYYIIPYPNLPFFELHNIFSANLFDFLHTIQISEMEMGRKEKSTGKAIFTNMD